jgi:pimeloyl-ACP methyl ester carboxylesterase
MRLSTCLVLAAGVGLSACGKKKEEPKPMAPSASAPAVVEAPKPPPVPPTPSEPATFESKDGVPLAGLYFDAGGEAPLVVFVHRFRGDRTEWAPLVERMAKSERRFSMLNFDLRGHGESATSTGKDRLSWSTMKKDDIPRLVTDVHAAIDYGVEKSEGKSSGVVLVGSSLGGALAAAAAGENPKVVALALVSPGAAIEGFSVYYPFADVRTLPSFLANAKEDNVSKDPFDALGRMAKENATTKTYDSGAHGAFALLGTTKLGENLEAWLLSVFDEKPKERQIREPGLAKKKSGKKKGK